MDEVRVALVGILGRMGNEISAELASRTGFRIVAGVDTDEAAAATEEVRVPGSSHPAIRVYGSSDLESALAGAEVYVGFSSPAAELKNARVAADLGKKVVIGTTGIPPNDLAGLKEYLATRVPAIVTSNFSIGANLMFELAKMTRLLPDGYDVSIVEAHHTRKKDAPSGTALAIAERVLEAKGYAGIVDHRPDGVPRKEGELEVVAVRAGGIPGMHEILIAGPQEVIRFEHIVFSRRAFASGVAESVRFLHRTKRPGLYDVAEALGSGKTPE